MELESGPCTAGMRLLFVSMVITATSLMLARHTDIMVRTGSLAVSSSEQVRGSMDSAAGIGAVRDSVAADLVGLDLAGAVSPDAADLLVVADSQDAVPASLDEADSQHAAAVAVDSTAAAAAFTAVADSMVVAVDSMEAEVTVAVTGN